MIIKIYYNWLKIWEMIKINNNNNNKNMINKIFEYKKLHEFYLL